MEGPLEFLIAQLVGRVREAGEAPPPASEPPPRSAPPPASGRRYPMPVARRPASPPPRPGPRRPAAPVSAPPIVAVTEPARATAPLLPPVAPAPPVPLLAAFSNRERLLGAIVLSEALAPPPALRPRNPGGGF